MTANSILNSVVADLVTCNGLEHLPVVDRLRLDRAWRAMPAWPDAPNSIATLRKRFVVVPLTILSWSMAVGSSWLAGIAWDGLLSCDLLGSISLTPDASRVPPR